MYRSTIILSILFAGVLSFNAQAQDVNSEMNPATEESTTTTVNPNTQQTTVTQTNPVTGETTTTIITPAPAPQDTIAAPQGYANCFIVAAGWYQQIWVPEHKVCQYDTTKGTYEGSAWVDGHWACTQYRASEGACTKWEWKSGHWVKKFEVY